MKKEQILLIVGVFVVVVAAFAFIANEGLFTARVAPTGGRSVNPDYSLSFPFSEWSDGTVFSSSFANNGAQFYTTRRSQSNPSSFEVLSYSADSGSLLWSHTYSLSGGASSALVIAGRGTKVSDVFVVLFREIISSYPSNSYRYFLSKYSSTSNGIPEWTRELETIPVNLIPFQLRDGVLFVSDDGSKIVFKSRWGEGNAKIFNSGGVLLNEIINPGMILAYTIALLSADGSTFIIVDNISNSSRINAYYLNSATPTIPIVSPGSPYANTEWASVFISKDGTYIAYYAGKTMYSIHNKILIFKKTPTGSYSQIFLDDIGVAEFLIPGTTDQVYDLYAPHHLPSSFNDLDEFMIGTIYAWPNNGSIINLFSYRKTSSTTFERISRYNYFFPLFPRANYIIFLTGITPLLGSDFLVSFVNSEIPGSPEAFILNPYEGTPKKVFNFPMSSSYYPSDIYSIYRGSAGASPDGSLISYTYYGAPGSPPTGWNTNTNMIHSSMIPTNFTATDGLFLERVRLTWSSVSGSTGYDVFRNTLDDVFSAVQLNASPVVSLSYEDSSGAPGQVYYYWVRARAGSDAFSFSLSDLGYRAVAPATPSGLTASQNFNDRVVLSWDYPNSSTYGYDFFPHATFNVYRSNTQTVPITGTPYASAISARTFTDLSPFPIGSRNYYRVVSVNAAGSAASGVVMGQVVAARASEVMSCFPGDVLNADTTCSRTVVGASLDGGLTKSGSSWSVVRDAVQSDGFTDGSTYMFVRSDKFSVSSYSGSRSVLSFNLGDMSGATVVSARLTVTGSVNSNTDYTGSVSLMPWSPSGASLDNSDYGRIPLTSGSRLAPSVPYSMIASSIIFSFNSAGVSYVTNSLSSGKVSFGLVEGHHLDNNPYVYPQSSVSHSLRVNTTENTTYAKPTLTITYRR